VPLGEEKSEIQIIPNPATKLSRFLMGKETKVQVYDIRGRRVFEGQGKEVEWQPGGSGVYFARFGKGDQRTTKKILVLK